MRSGRIKPLDGLRAYGPHIALVFVALVVRVGFLVNDSYPYTDSGLAADSAEMARQIDQHGRWFEVNLPAANYLNGLQNKRLRLIDPASLNFRAADAHPQMQAEVAEPPGEAVVLAGVWKITGEYWLPYQILTVVLSALMTPLVFYVGLRLFDRRQAAFIAAGLYTVFPSLAWLSTIPHVDTWSVDFTIAATAATLWALDKLALKRLVIVGLLVGFGCYFRPELLMLVPLIALALLRGATWRRSLRLAAIPTLVAVLLVVPWTVRNAVDFHKLIPLRTGAGQALWEGLGEVPNHFGAVLNDGITFAQVHRVRPNLVYGSPAYDAYLQSKALRVIENHPGFFVKLVAKRLVDSTLLLNNADGGWLSALSLTPAEQTLARDIEPILFLLSLAVILATRRRFGRSHLVLGAVIVTTILTYDLLHLEARYALPASFAYLLWTGLGIDLAASRLASVRTGRYPLRSRRGYLIR